MNPANSSYWKIFRLIFTMFSLYLLGDAFFRWDAFRYYAPFSEFLPAVALATVLWSAVSVLASLLAWIPLKVLERLFPSRARSDLTERWMLFICLFLLLSITLWLGKRTFWEHGRITLQVKLAALSGITAAAVFLAWLLRNRAVQWMDAVQDRVTPLLWLFGVCFILSVPLVAYCTWGKETHRTAVKEIVHPAPDKNLPNIILVTFDALAAGDMSVYGYERPTTPFISEWAKTAVLFTRTEAASNWTPPTTSTLMTGKRVWTHRTYHEKGTKPFRSSTESLPLLLKKNGYYNMAFIVNHLASVQTLGVADSFDVAPPATAFSTPVSLLEIADAFLYGLFGEKIRLYDWVIKEDFILSRVLSVLSSDYSVTTVPPSKAFNRFLEIMDDNPPTRPFFAWIHLFPPHFPYLPPEPFMGMFDSSPQFRTRKSQDREMWISDSRYNQAAVGVLRARYDEFIRYCDSEFEGFINELQKRGLLKNSVIILSSDHGESFQRRYLRHGGEHLYEQVTRIPLIIKEPGRRTGTVINALAGQADIPATILALAGIPVPSWMEGRSLVPLMKGEETEPRPEFSMNLQTNPSRGHRITKGVVAVWDGEYKLIHNLKENTSLLFNLKKDPGELENLVDREPETARRLLFLIQDSLRKANDRIRREG
ncbi:MAG: sulfatase-like hydrolase/transferase [Deferribacteres bacterium]|nr:sulfatase-like hydrolase/transferase [Deferribacteres bacterium]